MLRVIAAVAASLTLATAASAATLSNGSFEVDPGVISQGVGGTGGGADFSTMTSSGRSWGIWTNPFPGWSTGENGIELQTERTLGVTAYDGDFYVELDTRRNSKIWQDVTLTEGSYVMSFAFSPRRNDPNTNVVEFGVEGTTLMDTITGPGNGTSRGQWTVITRKFKVESDGTYRLFLAAGGTSDSLGGFIDDVSLEAVPLPAAGVLLIAALGGLVAFRRRA